MMDAEDLLIADDEMRRTADLSEDGLYRWRLTRVWGSTLRLMRFIMLNPSTADATEDDPTIRRCIGFARRLGWDGISVTNLYAYRATDPDDLWKAANPTGGRLNDRVLRTELAVAYGDQTPVIAAWGTLAEPDRVAWLLRQPHARQVLQALHVTRDGHPGHPLYLPGTAVPAPWPPPPPA